MAKATPVTQKKKISAEARRVQVAQLVVSGASQRQIARTLGVSAATINKDLKILRTAWLAAAVHKIDMAIMIDLQRLDRLILAVWKEATATVPDLAKITEARKLIEARARVLNYGAHTLTPDPEDPDGESVVKPVVTFIEVVKSYDDDDEDEDEEEEEAG